MKEQRDRRFRRTGSPNKKHNKNLMEKYKMLPRLKQQLAHITNIHKAPDTSPVSNVVKLRVKAVCFGAQVYGKYFIFYYLGDKTHFSQGAKCIVYVWGFYAIEEEYRHSGSRAGFAFTQTLLICRSTCT